MHRQKRTGAGIWEKAICEDRQQFEEVCISRNEVIPSGLPIYNPLGPSQPVSYSTLILFQFQARSGTSYCPSYNFSIEGPPRNHRSAIQDVSKLWYELTHADRNVTLIEIEKLSTVQQSEHSCSRCKQFECRSLTSGARCSNVERTVNIQNIIINEKMQC